MNLPPDITLREAAFDAARAERWTGWLSEEERVRWQAFSGQKRRREFLLGRATARSLVAERLDCAPADAPLKTAGDGAVDVVGSDLHVSIAHSGERAAVVVAERPVGVDLERIRARRDGVERFVLHPDEGALLGNLPLPHEEALILVWTIKEAVLKARRTGLRTLPTRLRLAVEMDEGTAQVHPDEGSAWTVRFEKRGAFYLAVALQG